jgi:branched-chain amino acid transport system substrate-binding protein
VAPPEPKFAELGDACLYIIGSSQWEPIAKYSAEAAKKENVEWFGPSVADFTKDYKAKFNEEPSYHSAGGYVSGLLIQKAIAQAGGADTAKIKEVLDKTNLMTFYGLLKFDTTPKNHGLQVGHEMIYIQWQKGPDGKPVKVGVFPEAAATAAPLLIPAK